MSAYSKKSILVFFYCVVLWRGRGLAICLRLVFPFWSLHVWLFLFKMVLIEQQIPFVAPFNHSRRSFDKCTFAHGRQETAAWCVPKVNRILNFLCNRYIIQFRRLNEFWRATASRERRRRKEDSHLPCDEACACVRRRTALPDGTETQLN